MANFQQQRNAIETILGRLDDEEVTPLALANLDRIFLPNGQQVYPAGISVSKGSRSKRGESVLVLVDRPVVQGHPAEHFLEFDSTVHRTGVRLGAVAFEAVQAVEVLARTNAGTYLAAVGDIEPYFSV